jgi:hypothetical protein
MSGILSLLREVLQTNDPAKYHEKPLLILCLNAACIFALGILWWEERQGRIKAEKVLNDARPVVGLNVQGVEGPKAWADHPVPVTFTIQHLSGRLPTSIRFDPVPSKNGRFSLQFDLLPHVDKAPHHTGMRFEVIETGVPQLSASDWETTRPHQKQLLGLFFDDSPIELIKLDYSFAVHFLDGTDPRSQQFTLTFDKQRCRFLINPA